MMKTTMYAVPGAIARELKLADYRHSDQQDRYLLSQSDLRCYGIEQAIREGAFAVTNEEAKRMFNL